MAAAADLTLKNNAGADVTFNPYSISENRVEWTEAGAASILGTVRAVMGRTIPANKANGVYRGTGKLFYPVVNGTTGALDGSITMNFEILRPANLSTANVDEAYARFKTLVALALVKTLAESGALPT